jgi:tyrosine-protein kinase Etk/Wzc
MAQIEVERPEIANADWLASPGIDDDSVDLAEVFRKLRAGKRLIFKVTLTVFLVVTAVAFVLPFRYTSTTSFIPPANMNSGSSIASLVSGQLSALGAGDLLGGMKNPGDLYTKILKSRSIAQELVAKENLKQVYREKKESRAEKKLASATDITVDSKSSIVTVEVTDKDPHRAQKLASDYMEALQETNGRLALTQAAQRAKFFGDQLAKEKDALEEAEVSLKQTEERSGLIAPSGQTETEIRTLANTQAQIAGRQVELAGLRQSATEQNPQIIRLKSEIDDLEGQLERLESGNGKSSVVAIPASKVPALQLEYVRKERDVKYHETLFEILSRQYEAARLDEAREAPLLQVLDAASYPDMKSSPKRSYYMLGGLAGGLFIGCVWVLIASSQGHAALNNGPATPV